MAYGEAEIEQDIKDKVLTAPRVTPDSIDLKIVGEQYYVFPGTTVTVCALKLENGFVVVGQSAAASKDNFNEHLGAKIARADAREKIWPLEGYLLRESLNFHGD